ncbi:ArsR/SmtB family transcription factor [Agromyces sp. NPDC058126]|uniref:ArsR/SmtB family transcription factor n=1 Tax=Agromyces sp. NPDC058126 TaxID=3346350 RepID=UPI0036DC7E4C
MDTNSISKLKEVEEVFGHPARLRIVRALLGDPVGLGQAQLKERTGLNASTLERHARILVLADILLLNLPLSETRRGRPLYYRLNTVRYNAIYGEFCELMRP